MASSDLILNANAFINIAADTTNLAKTLDDAIAKATKGRKVEIPAGFKFDNDIIKMPKSVDAMRESLKAFRKDYDKLFDSTTKGSNLKKAYSQLLSSIAPSRGITALRQMDYERFGSIISAAQDQKITQKYRDELDKELFSNSARRSNYGQVLQYKTQQTKSGASIEKALDNYYSEWLTKAIDDVNDVENARNAYADTVQSVIEEIKTQEEINKQFSDYYQQRSSFAKSAPTRFQDRALKSLYAQIDQQYRDAFVNYRGQNYVSQVELDNANKNAETYRMALSNQVNPLGVGNTVNAKIGQSLGRGFLQALGITGLAQSFSKMISNVQELDKAVVDLQVASGGSRDEVKELVRSYSDLGQEYGATTVEIAQGADAWLRQGYSMNESNELIKDSLMLSKLGQISTADATTNLTSAMKGFGIASKDAYKIVDKLTTVDMNAAVSAGDLATALSKTAVSADLGGINIDKIIGYLTVLGETTQASASVYGNAMKSMLARMGSIKAGKLVDTETQEDISNVEIVLSDLGLKLRENGTTWRNFGDILDDVNARWDSLNDTERRQVANAFGMTRNQEMFLVLMENYGNAIKYAQIAEESEGTASKKYQSYLAGNEAKVKSLQATFEGLSQDIFDSDTFGILTDGLSGIIGLFSSVAQAVGSTGVLGILSGIALNNPIKGIIGKFSQGLMSSKGAASINKELSDYFAVLDANKNKLDSNAVRDAYNKLSPGAQPFADRLDATSPGSLPATQTLVNSSTFTNTLMGTLKGLRINALISGGVALLGVAIKGISNFIKRDEIASNKAQKAVSEATNQLEALNNYYESNQTELDELLNKPEVSRSQEDNERIVELQAQQKELEGQINTQEAVVSSREQLADNAAVRELTNGNAVDRLQEYVGNAETIASDIAGLRQMQSMAIDNQDLYDYYAAMISEKEIALRDSINEYSEYIEGKRSSIDSLLGSSQASKNLIDDINAAERRMLDVEGSLNNYSSVANIDYRKALALQSVGKVENGQLQSFLGFLLVSGASYKESNAALQYLFGDLKETDALYSSAKQLVDLYDFNNFGFNASTSAKQQYQEAFDLLANVPNEIFANIGKYLPGNMSVQEYLSTITGVGGEISPTAMIANALVGEDLSVLGEISTDEMLAAQEQGIKTAKDFISFVQKARKEGTLNLTETAASMSKINTGFGALSAAITEQAADGYLSKGAIDALISSYEALGISADTIYGAINEVNGVMNLNINAAYDSINAVAKEKLAAVELQNAQKRLRLSYLTNEIGLQNLTEEQQNEVKSLRSNIYELESYEAQLRSATSAYSKWKLIKSTGNAGKQFENDVAGTMVKDINDAIKKRRTGSANLEYGAAVDYIFGGKISSEDEKSVKAGMRALSGYNKVNANTGRQFLRDMKNGGLLNEAGTGLSDTATIDDVARFIGSSRGGKDWQGVSTEYAYALMALLNEYEGNDFHVKPGEYDTKIVDNINNTIAAYQDYKKVMNDVNASEEDRAAAKKKFQESYNLTPEELAYAEQYLNLSDDQKAALDEIKTAFGEIGNSKNIEFTVNRSQVDSVINDISQIPPSKDITINISKEQAESDLNDLTKPEDKIVTIIAQDDGENGINATITTASGQTVTVNIEPSESADQIVTKIQDAFTSNGISLDLPDDVKNSIKQISELDPNKTITITINDNEAKTEITDLTATKEKIVTVIAQDDKDNGIEAFISNSTGDAVQVTIKPKDDGTFIATIKDAASNQSIEIPITPDKTPTQLVAEIQEAFTKSGITFNMSKDVAAAIKLINDNKDNLAGDTPVGFTFILTSDNVTPEYGKIVSKDVSITLKEGENTARAAYDYFKDKEITIKINTVDSNGSNVGYKFSSDDYDQFMKAAGGEKGSDQWYLAQRTWGVASGGTTYDHDAWSQYVKNAIAQEITGGISDFDFSDSHLGELIANMSEAEASAFIQKWDIASGKAQPSPEDVPDIAFNPSQEEIDAARAAVGQQLGIPTIFIPKTGDVNAAKAAAASPVIVPVIFAPVNSPDNLNGGGIKTTPSGSTDAFGNALALGNARDNGKWGEPKATEALVGELGQELVVDPRNGTWHTVGDNGAEFTHLPKDAIVFNHKQTEEILKNRHINSRGQALASGNSTDVKLSPYPAGTFGYGPIKITIEPPKAEIVDDPKEIEKKDEKPKPVGGPPDDHDKNSSAPSKPKFKGLKKKNKWVDYENMFAEQTDDWFDRQEYNIEDLEETLTEARQRYTEDLENGYKLTKKQMEELNEWITKADKALYEMKEKLWEEQNERDKTTLEHLKSQSEAILSIRDNYHELENAIRDERYELQKEYDVARDAFPLMTEMQKEARFSTEDYQKLMDELDSIAVEAANVLEDRDARIKAVGEDETYLIETIEREAERALNTLMKSYETTKAELAVQKAQNALNNAKANRTTAVLYNGQWTWTWDYQTVQDAMEQLSDAEQQLARAESEQAYNLESNNMNDYIDQLTDQISAIDTLVFSLDDVAKEVHDLTDKLRDAFPAFAAGGVNTTTGPAIMHGTRSNPEVVFNSAAASKLYSFVNNIPDISSYMADSIITQLNTNVGTKVASASGNAVSTMQPINDNRVYIDKIEVPEQYADQFLSVLRSMMALY